MHLSRAWVRPLLTGALVLAPLAVVSPAGADADDVPSAAVPETVDLDAPAHGRKAVSELGEDLDVAAAANGMTERDLRDLLLSDLTAWVDEHGRVFYVEPTADAVAADDELPAYQAVDAFALHNKPGSQHVIFLDFDGHLVSGTAWNTSGVSATTHPAWTLDGDATTFSTAERDAISSIWARVAEDYAPFDVDVTTQDPGAAAISRTSASDPTYGTRVLISPSTQAQTALCPHGCGGVAYLDVFDGAGSQHDFYQPAWVFPHRLGNSTKSIAEASSHEAGHNFGLNHDATSTSSYYSGHAMWAPIMGVGYSKPVVQWSQGGYTDASTTENDVAIIAANGAPYRADEAGGTVGTAEPVTAGTAYVTTRTDVDVWSLGTCTGSVTLSADPAATSPNLDIELTLLSAGGATVATANPVSATSTSDVATGLAASIATTVTSGAYFLRVDGVGNGTATSGYDDYGSLGAYTLSTTGCGGGPVEPVAPGLPTGLNVVPAGNGQSATFSWAPPLSDGGSTVTGYVVQRSGGSSQALGPSASSTTFSGLTPGATYSFYVSAVNVVGTGSPASTNATMPVPATVPSAATAPSSPLIGVATSGRKGARATATARWSPPTSTGGAALTAYQVVAHRIGPGGVVSTLTSAELGPGRTRLKWVLPRGRYRFAVRAANSAGWGELSARSAIVRAR